MELKDFYYALPPELIAQHPLKNRSSSRLLMLNRETGAVRHGVFTDILDKLNQGDCLVLNDTRVIPARLYGAREDTGGAMEFLLLSRKEDGLWEVIVKPGKRALPGRRFVFGNGELKAEIIEVLPDGNRIVRFEYDGIFEHVLDKLGEMPLPHYITERLQDKERYQTVYSKEQGSAAAPTAGLHFTDELLEKVSAKGVKIAYLTLHVGLGTFRPVKVKDFTTHQMHSEYYTVSQQAADIINEAKSSGGKVIAVGTTSVRTLESVTDQGKVLAKSGWTDIFIYPPYTFQISDAIITNFHLPESTLIMLISAFAGRENVLNAYKQAIDEKYRFFSFGDAMYIGR